MNRRLKLTLQWLPPVLGLVLLAAAWRLRDERALLPPLAPARLDLAPCPTPEAPATKTTSARRETAAKPPDFEHPLRETPGQKAKPADLPPRQVEQAAVTTSPEETRVEAMPDSGPAAVADAWAVAETPCLLSGHLQLLSASGAALASADQAVVYAVRVPPQAWSHQPHTYTVIQKDQQFFTVGNDQQLGRPLLVVVRGDSVRFTNEDRYRHSVFSVSPDNDFELGESTKGTTGVVTFGELGGVLVWCHNHSRMRADLLVVENPFFGFVQADGSWSLPALPRGEYELGVWERNGATELTQKIRCSGPTHVKPPPLRRRTEPSRPPGPGDY